MVILLLIPSQEAQLVEASLLILFLKFQLQMDTKPQHNKLQPSSLQVEVLVLNTLTRHLWVVSLLLFQRPLLLPMVVQTLMLPPQQLEEALNQYPIMMLSLMDNQLLLSQKLHQEGQVTHIN
jgi:hypothetical protein